jgi:hypothetical protein
MLQAQLETNDKKVQEKKSKLATLDTRTRVRGTEAPVQHRQERNDAAHHHRDLGGQGFSPGALHEQGAHNDAPLGLRHLHASPSLASNG